MINLYKFTLKHIILLLLLSFNCSATWYQGSATQPIEMLNFEETRIETIKRAIANAAMKSNSFIQMEDIVLDGLLLSSKTVLRSQGQIRRAEIISESVNDDILSVIVKVDVEPLISCQKDPYAKSLLVTQFPLLKPNQAAQGALFDIGAQVSRRFEMQLGSKSGIIVNYLLNKSFVPDEYDDKQNYLTEVGSYLAEDYESQFILFGVIRDISLFEQVKDEILIDSVLLRRNFTFQLYLYDAIRGEILIQKNYHSEANWKYEQNHIVDTNNSVFWRSDYGRSVLHTIDSAVTDINDTLSCQQSLSQIIHHDKGQLVINIGKMQGVKVGDEFEIVMQRSIQGGNGKTHSLLLADNSRTLNVIEVNNKNSVLVSNGVDTIDNSQTLNYVSPKFIF